MATGPETITVYKIIKRDGDFVKFDDNQQHKWNCSVGVISANITEGMTIDVWWDPYEGSLPDGTTYTSKYIQKAAPSKNPPQELKEPFKGGSGGGKSSGKKDSDYRSRGEIIACVALEVAVQPYMSSLTSASDSDVRRNIRTAVMKDADVYVEYIIEKGKDIKETVPQETPAWADDKPDPGEPQPDPPSAWGADNDDDIPF